MATATAMFRFRSSLAYLALGASLATFLPGSASAVVVIAGVAILLGWRQLRPVARGIAVLVFAVSLFSLLADPGVLASASQSMAGIVGLVLAVMLLSAVLSTSEDLGVISRSLFNGRSASRYLGLSLGTWMLSFPLNFGAVGLTAPMIGQQVQSAGDGASTRNAARAVLRGFGGSPMASPLSIAVVMTITLLPGLASWTLLVWSVPFALTYLLVGALFREQEMAVPAQAQVTASSDERALWPWLRFIGLALLIALQAFALNTWVNLKYSQAVTLSCLTAVTLLLAVRRLVTGVANLPSMANVANELAIMGGASFLGGALAVMALSSLGSHFALPDWAYPVTVFCIPWLFFAAGAMGANPIVSASVIGGVLGPLWPEPALLGLGVAMVTGWGVSTAGTPYTANVMLLERFTGYKTRMATYGWNLSFSLFFLGLSGCFSATIVLVSS
ncbi:hypothetical protein [Marinobacter sp. X15-166B]|uniref:hypothetical protein n=1 Tax=Marinobacter sp. X15-166B TaxID=1897620 RepID=UPI00085CDC03|nr:hypothetical protein [Marinobacter sp. X15-166B]OEY66382.1 hypothetical protein BG841_07860 [Marinobacter sp. X15-166B]